MRQKYVDEAIGVWFIFGKYKSGKVDISDGTKDVFTHIPPDIAEKLCDLQAEFRNKLYEITDNL